MGKSWRVPRDVDKVRFKPKRKDRIKTKPLFDRYLMEIDKIDQEIKDATS